MSCPNPHLSKGLQKDASRGQPFHASTGQQRRAQRVAVSTSCETSLLDNLFTLASTERGKFAQLPQCSCNSSWTLVFHLKLKCSSTLCGTIAKAFTCYAARPSLMFQVEERVPTVQLLGKILNPWMSPSCVAYGTRGVFCGWDVRWRVGHQKEEVLEYSSPETKPHGT